ncbi:MAG: hypothetical protein GX568_04480, partial [Candidatus Gastranaerophilales bacterium]|nr:hypothetical protein [Candidatus Gastranaerophilales bacterium]
PRIEKVIVKIGASKDRALSIAMPTKKPIISEDNNLKGKSNILRFILI